MTNPTDITLKEKGDQLQASGNTEDALAAYQSALRHDPVNARAWRAAFELVRANPALMALENLARQYTSDALKQACVREIQQAQIQGALPDALIWASALRALDPDNGEFRIVTGMILLGMEKQAEAIDELIAGLECAPDNPVYRTFLTNALAIAGIQTFSEKIKRWLVVFLQEPQSVNISALAGLWYSLLQKDPSMAILQPGIGIINYEFFRTWIDTQPEQELAKCLNSDFFIEGLRKLIVADLAYAQFLTHMRRRLFDYYNEGQPEPIWAEELALALAEQGFITEYAACETPEETTGIAKMLRTAQGARVFECALLACYRPLNSTSALAKALRKNPSTALRPIIQQQIEQPRQESVLAITVKSIGGLKDRISAKVRKQYEENPYPRWISIGRVQMNNDMVIAQNPDYARAQSILVAGCGTGSHLLSVALMHPGAMVTGLDLSRASLAYARRKSEEMGIKNVRLIQGDLQNVVKLKQEFDIIESVGVLHHLADPEKGWQALAAVLKPRGLMKIGLYSSTAREHIIDCQKWLDDRDIPPTPEGIRQARKILIDLPDDHPFKSMTGYFDFYTTSMVRDFLFHVQEHNFSIERIRDDIGNLGLSFIGFSGIGRKMAALYREAYPMDTGMTDLANWAAFEQAHPQCFIGMYVFWCRKEGK